MAKYKVITIAHLCKNNHLAKYGEIVDESQLTSNAYELVNAKFIEPVGEIVDESQKDEKVESNDEVKNIDVKGHKFMKPKK